MASDAAGEEPADELISSSQRALLAAHGRDLLAFGRRTALPGGGAAWLDDDGRPDTSQPTFTWITARMTHVYGLGSLLGVPGSAAIARQAMAGLTGALRDRTSGGWHPSTVEGAAAPGKSCYDHAFVLLAATTATQAELDGARALFDDAADTFLARFWDDERGLCVDAWDTTFTTLDTYRGVNANMHAAEAMIAAAGVTGDNTWLERAARIAAFVVTAAEANGWRIPEHFDASWQPMLDYNHDTPAHQFKPYGATVGHAFEWSRLLTHLTAAPGREAPPSLDDAAVQLFERATRDGWFVDGAPGFVYTTDWDGSPVVRDRMHWVVAEATNAAAVLHHRTGEQRYADWYHLWWQYAVDTHVDHAHGSWIHQLDATNAPSSTVWRGKPDLYHAFQATLIPTLPLYPTLPAALAG